MRAKELIALFSLMACIACGPSGLDFGKLSKKKLVQEKGEPVRVDSIGSGKQVLVYPDDNKYQVDGEWVEATFRKPSPEERSLLYWRHKFKKYKTTLRRLPVAPDSHLMPEQELACVELGITVIYDPNIDKIIRVIQYAKKK